jgi:hypothetical protein
VKSIAEIDQILRGSDQAAPAERLLKFEAWLSQELQNRLAWPQDPIRRRKQVGQCSAFVRQFVHELNRRGWLFDAKELASVIRERLDEIRRAQDAGRVKDLYPFFRSIFNRYAGQKAEELRAKATSVGARIDLVKARHLTLVEIVAQSEIERAQERRLRDEASALRRARRAPDPHQPTLFG